MNRSAVHESQTMPLSTGVPRASPTPGEALLAACTSHHANYEPEFHVEPCATGQWIKDRDRPIAYIHRAHHLLDAFEFSPFSTLGREAVVHPRYDHATSINMHATLFPRIGQPYADPDGDWSLDWDTRDAHRLTLTARADYRSGESAHDTLSVGYDPAIGQYVYRLDYRLWLPEPRRVEFCNMLVKHLGDAMPATKRWQHTVWSGADGRMWKMPHTPAATFAMRPLPQQRRKRLAPGGFIGWGTEPDFNLVAVFERASMPLSADTCDCWYDEHLCLDPPSMEHEADHGYAMEVSLRLLHVPQQVMRRTLAHAAPTTCSAQRIARHGVPAMRFGEVNDLESAMDPNVPDTAQVWRPTGRNALRVRMGERFENLAAERTDHAAWVNDCSHSGTRSLRLRGLVDQPLHWTAEGPNFHVKPNTRYRFTAWVRTADAKARLWLGTCWHNWNTFHDQVYSEPVVARSDWTPIGVDICTEDYPFICCHLVVEGAGEAWFDDLLLEQVSD